MKIKMLFMDVDGTLTDGKIYMGQSGEICKAFNIKDGYGIHDILIPEGIIPVIITGRRSAIVENRSRELGIEEIHQGIACKTQKTQEVIRKYNLELSNAAYIGDDLNDIECMRLIKDSGGIVGCPSDAVKEVRKISDFVAAAVGGNGAVREFIEFLTAGGEE